MKLYSTPQNYVKDVRVVTDIDGKAGIIRYETEVCGSGQVRVEVRDAAGALAGTAEGGKGEIRIENAVFWKPMESYLYRFTVIVGQDDKAQEDVYTMKVGIRTVSVDNRRFYVNGEPVYFKGFGKHEDMDIKGKGLDQAMWIKDFT